jgi:hypothetical protein
LFEEIDGVIKANFLGCFALNVGDKMKSVLKKLSLPIFLTYYRFEACSS